MFIEAHELPPNGSDRTWDICIVGAGVAGLSLVRGLAGCGLDVLLLESGGVAPRQDAEILLRGSSNRSDYPFVTSRARVFGGTSTIWSGACIPLDPMDFTRREWMPHSEWPISEADLLPYYDAAAHLFGRERWNIDEGPLAGSALNRGDLCAMPVFTSTPLDLGRTMAGPVRGAARVVCATGATVTGLLSNDAGSRVTGAVFHDRSGTRREVDARAVVLATGGIEAPRLLLAADRSAPNGLGEVRASTGRYYMDHPVKSVGILPVGRLRRDFLPFTNGWKDAGVPVLGTIGLSRAARAREELLDMHLRVYRYSRFEDEPAIIGLKRAAGMRAATGGSAFLSEHGPGALPKAAAYGAWHIWNKVSRSARFDHVRFLAFIEQEPDPENRITLGAETDPHGIPYPHLQFEESEVFHRSIERTSKLLSQAFARAGLPGARMGLEASDHIAHYGGHGLHHMGSTRMSEDAKSGTVDRDCRIHGTEGLYVASSSVFPTGGAANPTFTISALSLRLADHLKRMLTRTGR